MTKMLFPVLRGFELGFLDKVPKRTPVSELSFEKDEVTEWPKISPHEERYIMKLRIYSKFIMPRGLSKTEKEYVAAIERQKIMEYIFRGLTKRIDEIRYLIFELRQTVNPSHESYGAINELEESFDRLASDLRGEIDS